MGYLKRPFERNDREDAGFRDRQQMLVDSDGRGTVLTGGTQALLKEHPPGDGVDSTEHASGPQQIKAILINHRRGNFRDASVEAPGKMGLGDVSPAARRDGTQMRSTVTNHHFGNEFFLAQKPVLILSLIHI